MPGSPNPVRGLRPHGRPARFLRLVVLAALALVATIFALGSTSADRFPSMSTTELAGLARQGQVQSITQTGDELVVVYGNPATSARVSIDPRTDVYALLSANGVPRTQVDAMSIAYGATASVGWTRVLALALPMLGLPLLLFFLLRRGASSAGTASDFGRTSPPSSRRKRRRHGAALAAVGARARPEDLRSARSAAAAPIDHGPPFGTWVEPSAARAMPLALPRSRR